VANESILISEVIPASPQRIFSAWLDSAEHSAITGDEAMVIPAVGGEHRAASGYIQGRTLELHEGSRIVQSWRTTEFPPDSPDSRLEITLEPTLGGTLVTLLHTDIPSGQSDQYKQGWNEYYLSRMKVYFANQEEIADDEETSRSTNGIPSPSSASARPRRPRPARAEAQAPKARPSAAPPQAAAAAKAAKPTSAAKPVRAAKPASAAKPTSAAKPARAAAKSKAKVVVKVAAKPKARPLSAAARPTKAATKPAKTKVRAVKARADKPARAKARAGKPIRAAAQPARGKARAAKPTRAAGPSRRASRTAGKAKPAKAAARGAARKGKSSARSLRR
jgi:uncharacterized protein YndB with AHSA1/START domain